MPQAECWDAVIGALLQEAQGRFLIPMRGEQEVNGLACRISGAVKVLPLALDLDVT
jgi:hypothetical protein